MKKNLIIITAACFLLTCSCTKTKELKTFQPPNLPTESTSIVSITPTERAHIKPYITTPNTENVTEVKEIEFCSKLEDILSGGGYYADDIKASEQVVTVVSDGTSCNVSFFELSDNTWEECFLTNGVVGKEGVSENSSENNCCTPKGIFPLGFAFGTEDLKGLSIEYRRINENCYWIDDPESELYNQWVESEYITWESAEHLIEYPESYKYAVSIEHNVNPVVPYKGSAIFLHCDDGKYEYTLGCIAIPEDDMLKLLKLLDQSKNPLIIIY